MLSKTREHTTKNSLLGKNRGSHWKWGLEDVDEREYCESGIILVSVWIATYSSKQSLGAQPKDR